MTILADPRHCPSCRDGLPSEVLVCRTCGLDLRGEPGMRLFALLTEADQLIAGMRARSAHVVASPTEPTPAGAQDSPAPPLSMAPVRSGAVTAATVPRVLLGLGAICVLVAGSLFLPFAWEVLGVTGRTVVLVLLTALAGVGTRVAGGRGLRATAESLAAVGLGLLALDLLGARTSGWFGEISDASLLLGLGATLAVAGSAAALLLTGSRVDRLLVAEGTAALGSGLAACGVLAQEVGTLGQRAAVVVPLLLVTTALTAALRPAATVRLVAATWAQAAVLALAWCGLLLISLVDLADGLSLEVMWPGGAGLTLTLAGLYAAIPAISRAATPAQRTGSLALASAPWTIALSAPAYDEGPGARLTTAVALLAVGVAAATLLPPRWRAVAGPVTALAGLVTAMLMLPLAAASLIAAGEAAAPLWGGSPTGSVEVTWDAAGYGSGWLLPVGVLALVTAGWLLLRGRLTVPIAGVSSTMVGLATAGALLLESAPVSAALAVVLTGAAGASVVAARGQRLEWQASQITLGAAALLLSSYDEWLSLVALAVLLVAASAHHLRGSSRSRGVAGAAACAMLAGLVWTSGALLGAEPAWRAAVVIAVLGAATVLRGLNADLRGIVGVEIGAASSVTLALLAGTDAAPAGQPSVWLAVYLTLAGVATTVVALTRADRRGASWPGGLLLALATWVRLEDLGVTTVEAYTLPSALVLLATGWWHTRQHTEVGTLRAWSPGLGLALVPSLLWALTDPLSWRAVILGLACLALTVGGAQSRVAAPFAWGATVGALLAVWEVLPPALEASAWLVTGLAGAILLAVGASWDRRVHDARAVAGYVSGLR